MRKILLVIPLAIFAVAGAMMSNNAAADSDVTLSAVTTSTSTSSTTTTSSSTTSTTAPAAQQLADEVSAYLATRKTTASVAIYDSVTGETWSSSNTSYDTASIIKVSILEALVLRAQEAGRGLTSDEYATAKKMISVSDNDAATKLWKANGSQAGMKAFFSRIGATSTTANVQWGLTQTTAADQVAIVGLYAYANDILTDKSRQVIQDLMKTVVSSQHWGVSAGVDGGSSVQLKNGWLPRNGKWDINSIGHVDVNGHDYVVAILSKGSASQAYGIATVEGLSRLVWSASAVRE